jgi:hypothetical protein
MKQTEPTKAMIQKERKKDTYEIAHANSPLQIYVLLNFSHDFANATIATYFAAHLRSIIAHSILHVVL